MASYKNRLFFNNAWIGMILFLTSICFQLNSFIINSLSLFCLSNCILQIYFWWSPGERIMRVNTFLPKLILDTEKCSSCNKDCYPWDFKYNLMDKERMGEMCKECFKSYNCK